MTSTVDPITILEHAMNTILNEIFKNGTEMEEGCKILEDFSHPLSQAHAIMLKAQLELRPEFMTALRKKAAEMGS